MKGWLLITGMSLLVTAPVPASFQPDSSQAFLREVLRFGATDLQGVALGRAAVRSLETVDAREVAIAGAIRVAVRPDAYINLLRDIVEFKRHEAVLQIGTFTATTSVADLAGLTLDRDHLADLRDCEVRDCDLQLSRAAIQRFRGLQWSAPDAASRANQLMREILADLVVNYRQSGDAALMTYENEARPLTVAAEFRAMIAAPPAILRRFPPLERHMTRYPAAGDDRIDDVIYWSKEDVGPKVVISVTHLAILPIEDAGAVVYAAASKQLYGSHYFDSSLGLTLLLRDNDPNSTLLVYINRSRVDELDGFLGGLKRAVVRSRARHAMEESLTRIRTRLPARVKR